MAEKRKPKRTTARKVQAAEGKPFVVPEVNPPKPDEDVDDSGEDGLTIRQRLFVQAITGPCLGNATRAAEMAGYRADNYKSLQASASQTLSKVIVQQAIAHALARKRMGKEWAESQVVDRASSTMANFVTVGPDGQSRLDMAKGAAAGALSHIAEYTEKILKSGDSEDSVVIIERKIKIRDNVPGLQMYLRMMGMSGEQQPEEEGKEIQIRPMTGGEVRKKPDDPGGKPEDVRPE